MALLVETTLDWLIVSHHHGHWTLLPCWEVAGRIRSSHLHIIVVELFQCIEALIETVTAFSTVLSLQQGLLILHVDLVLQLQEWHDIDHLAWVNLLSSARYLYE